ncbi:MAG: hypothetical protein ACRERC_21185 [Candidatus Binatia bacterium]
MPSPVTHAVACGLAAVAVVLGLPRAVVGQLERSGGEFQVNTFTLGNQAQPAAAMAAAGPSVVVWAANAPPRVLGQRYDAAGAPLGGELLVNSFTEGDRTYPAVASAADGAFVVVWSSTHLGEESISARRFDAAGAPQGSEFRVDSAPFDGLQHPPAVAVDADGDFVVVWRRFYESPFISNVFARRYDSGGTPAGAEFRVNEFATSFPGPPSIAMNGGGDFVVAWHNADDYGAVGARLFASGGTPASGDVAIDTSTSTKLGTAAAMQADGSFVVVWNQSNPRRIRGRRYDTTGNAIDAAFEVAPVPAPSFPHLAATAGPDGNFLVAWEQSAPDDGDASGVRAQYFGPAGGALGAPLLVNTFTAGAQEWPSVATDGKRFLVAWQSDGAPPQDGAAAGVFAQMLRVAASPTPTETATVTPTSTPSASPSDSPSPPASPSDPPTAAATATVTPAASQPTAGPNAPVVPAAAPALDGWAWSAVVAALVGIAARAMRRRGRHPPAADRWRLLS